LTNAVKRALALHSYIKDDALKTVIGQVDSLPSRPQVFAELTRALTDENTSLEDVGKIVETDVAISAKLLQVVNSAFFGLPQNMTKVKDAASYLGVNMLKSIVLSEEMYRSFKTDQAIPGFSLDEEYEKSFLCAQVAKKMVTSKEDTENAFMAGVLHRTGRLVLAKYLPDKLTQVLSEYNSSDKSLAEIEKAIVGASNEYVGAYLLGLWGLPYSVVEAVAHHNHPWVVEHSDFQILDAVYVASHLVAGVRNQSKDAELNMDYLQKIGVAKNLDQWRQLAEEIMGSVSDGKEG
jgi:HD-like signal output (HDOD) protein